MDEVRRIADAVLYEGYLLWPYRRSAMKNQQRWTFGGVYPEAHTAKRAGDDPCEMRAECLLEGDAFTEVDLTVRVLQVVRRQAYRDGEPVDELEAGGERRLSWDEATERELSPGPFRLGERQRWPITVPAGESREDLGGGAALVRTWRDLRGTLEAEAQALGAGVHRLRVVARNTSPFGGGDRGEALRHTFCSTHFVLTAHDGAFSSLTEAPEHQRDACENTGCWPVLVGEEGACNTVLCSPIILSDYPRVAPESPGDLFDGGEIDQLLVLNILALTDEEKREMRDSDPRAREILERTERLSEDELMRLHGAIREFGMVRRS